MGCGKGMDLLGTGMARVLELNDKVLLGGTSNEWSSMSRSESVSMALILSPRERV